jgi:ParB family chromosome partitioning protein
MTERMNLTGLAGLKKETVLSGEPLRLPLGVIEPDPNQPRKTFDQAKLEELAESAKEHGIFQPISVRPHPTKPGRYIINWGERRWRASRIAGLKDIPVIIHRKFNGYQQMIENVQRDDLTPMEIALFIHGEVAKGVEKGAIAAGLGKKSSSYVSDHLALVEAPLCVERAYASGVKSPRTLYDLRKAHEQFPVQVDQWVAEGAVITRDTIAAFCEQLRSEPVEHMEATEVDAQMPASASVPPSAFRHDESGRTAAGSVRTAHAGRSVKATPAPRALPKTTAKSGKRAAALIPAEAMPPQDVIEAAEKVGRWFAERNIKGWELGPCADRWTKGTQGGN